MYTAPLHCCCFSFFNYLFLICILVKGSTLLNAEACRLLLGMFDRDGDGQINLQGVQSEYIIITLLCKVGVYMYFIKLSVYMCSSFVTFHFFAAHLLLDELGDIEVEGLWQVYCCMITHISLLYTYMLSSLLIIILFQSLHTPQYIQQLRKCFDRYDTGI